MGFHDLLSNGLHLSWISNSIKAVKSVIDGPYFFGYYWQLTVSEPKTVTGPITSKEETINAKSGNQLLIWIAFQIMTGPRLQIDDLDVLPQFRPPTTATDLASDDDRSVAADSWSIKSEYGSTLDDEQRQVDAVDLLSPGNFRASSEYRLRSSFFSSEYRFF